MFFNIYSMNLYGSQSKLFRIYISIFVLDELNDEICLELYMKVTKNFFIIYSCLLCSYTLNAYRF